VEVHAWHERSAPVTTPPPCCVGCEPGTCAGPCLKVTSESVMRPSQHSGCSCPVGGNCAFRFIKRNTLSAAPSADDTPNAKQTNKQTNKQTGAQSHAKFGLRSARVRGCGKMCRRLKQGQCMRTPKKASPRSLGGQQPSGRCAPVMTSPAR
jgi:hypothetical protein